MGDNHGTSDGKTTPVVTVVVTTIATVVVITIVTALLTLGGNFLSDGGVVRLLGGLSVSQFNHFDEFQVGTNCGDRREASMTNAKKSICFLNDISIRQGNLIAAGNKGGWSVCKIEVATSGLFVLISVMDGSCPKLPGVPEISCKAHCISF